MTPGACISHQVTLRRPILSFVAAPGPDPPIAQGRGTEAHTLLSPIYERFTDGFTTPILVRANALLQATSRGK
jgi:hypothetical protein